MVSFLSTSLFRKALAANFRPLRIQRGRSKSDFHALGGSAYPGIQTIFRFGLSIDKRPQAGFDLPSQLQALFAPGPFYFQFHWTRQIDEKDLIPSPFADKFRRQMKACTPR